MTDNKQNSETEKMNSAASHKTTTGGSAASTKQAKEENSKPGDVGGKQNESSVKNTFEKAKESTGNITDQALGLAKDKAASVIGEQKTNLASGINTVADSIRQIGENLSNTGGERNQVAALASKYGDTLAEQVEKFSSYIDEKELRELARDLEKFARRNPLLFVGGAFTLGVLAARFLKSSGRKQSSSNRSRNSRSE